MVVEHGSRCFMCPWILFLGVCPNPRNSFQPHRTYLSYSHSVNKYLPLFIRTRTLFRFNKSEFCFPGLARIFWILHVASSAEHEQMGFKFPFGATPKKNYRREFVPTRPCRRSKKESWHQQSSSKITPSYIIVFSSTEVAVFDFFHSPTNEIETHNSCFRKLPNNPNESNPKIIHHEQAIQGRTSAW